MMFVLNMLVQMVGFAVAIYIAFTRSFARAVALVVVVGVLHFLLSKLSNLLMFIHQKTLSEDELQQIAGYGIPGLGVVPPFWRAISTASGVLFFCSAAAVIWYFLSS